MSECDLKFYENVDEKFYEDTCKSSINFIRSWFHNKRHQIVNEWIKKHYKPGQIILDLACGTCTWNSQKLPVTGVDISKKMLNYAKSKGRLQKSIKSEITDIKLNDSYADIIIIGDVLEHMTNYKQALKEAYRLLKLGGTLFVSVPYDVPLSLWWPLFNVYCLVKGYILGSKHHRAFAGHIIHFSPKKIRKAISESGFKILKQFNNKRFTIYTIATKN